MVLKDPFDNRRAGAEKKFAPGRDGAALPLDRLASHVADFILLLPLMALAMAPFRREVLDAKILGEASTANTSMLKGILAAALIGVLWETVLIAWRGTTPGRAIFGLRVVDIWTGEKPRPLHAFLRALAWWASILLLGAPFFGVYGNGRRRPVHDRIGDTEVRSRLTHRQSPPPQMTELALGSLLTTTSLALAALIVAGQFVLMRDHATELGNERRTAFCPTVSDSMEEWESRESKPTRIGVALSLSAADAIDMECLESEADFALWNDAGRVLGYFAKGVIRFSQDRSESDLYFSKACELEPDSDACRLGRWYRDVDPLSQDDNQFADSLEKIAIAHQDRKSVPDWWKLFVLRELMARDGAPEVILRLARMPSRHHLIGSRLVEYQARALWSLDRKSEARGSVYAVLDSLPRASKVAAASWLCGREIYENSCGTAADRACGAMNRAIIPSSGDYDSPNVLLSSLRHSECKAKDGTISSNYITQVLKHVEDPSAQQLLISLRRIRNGETEQGVDELRELASNPDATDDPYVTEANIRLIERLAGRSVQDRAAKRELRELRERWLNASNARRYVDWGRSLFAAFSRRKEWTEASAIGSALISRLELDRGLQKKVAIAAWRAGNRQLASQVLEAIERTRVPASLGATPLSNHEPSIDATELSILESIRRAGRRQ